MNSVPEDEPEQDEAISSLINALGECDPDAMSPREALEALYRLKDLFNQRSK